VEGVPRGQVVEKVACQKAPGQSYALYLPSAYSPEKLWPVLYMLDARGRALLAIERFRAAAEEFGWILVSSYNSRSDTKDDPNSPAMTAMWNDTVERLAIDGRRVYATGFSGGARAAVAIAFALPKRIAGVIGCGAGFTEDFGRDVPFPYFAIVGDRDFNYYEMRALDEKLSAAKAPHRIASFAGGHEWPPPPLAREAIAWMDLEAMKSGTLARDAQKLAALHGEALVRARAWEAAGRPAEAYRAYGDTAEDFRGLADVADEEAKAAAFAKDPRVQNALKEARRRDEGDRAAVRSLNSKLRRALAALDPPQPAMLAAELGIPALRRKAATAGSPEERLSAERILANLRVMTSFYLPQEMFDRRDPTRARLLLSVAAEIDPENPFVYYNLAAAAARTGDASRAIQDLERAVAKGFERFELIEEDADFAPVRGDEAFRKWLAAARGGA
jgi:predicted esterase